MKMAFRFLISLVAIGLSTGVAMAQELSNTAAGTALSGAVRSAGVGPTALAYNPAAMHQVLQYSVDTGYYYNPPASGHGFTASVVDSKTNETLAAGVSYTYMLDQSLDSELSIKDRTGHIIRGALATGYRTQGMAVHVGAGVTYFDSVMGGDNDTKIVTMDVGALLVVNNMFRLAVVGHNLIETDTLELPRRLGLGTSLLTSGFLVSFDTVLDFETADYTAAQYNVGAEYSVSDQVPIRIGYQYDELTKKQYISGGVGLMSQTMSFEFGFRQNLDDKEDNLFSFNLRAYLP